jgi:hypothetical protein
MKHRALTRAPQDSNIELPIHINTTCQARTPFCATVPTRVSRNSCRPETALALVLPPSTFHSLR